MDGRFKRQLEADITHRLERVMECVKMIYIRQGENTYKVPCGKCGFCLANKRSQWMFRVYQEMKSQGNPGWFITLTYNEKYVRRVADGRLSLRFKDVQLFFKRIRRAKFYAKYICVGEYGSKTNRPHYHLLLWTDCPASKLQDLWISASTMERLGELHFGRITMESAMYTLKYIIQPKQSDVDGVTITKKNEHGGIERTRAQFSKGIGLDYLSSAVYDYHTFDCDSPVFLSMVDGRKVSLPRYYRYKIFTKYQRRQMRVDAAKKSRTEYNKKLKACRAKGITKVPLYLKKLRSEQAERIIKSAKFNQTI